MRIQTLGLVSDVIFDDSIQAADRVRIEEAWRRCEIPQNDECPPHCVVHVGLLSGGNPTDTLHRDDQVEYRVIRGATLADVEQRLTTSLTLWSIRHARNTLLQLHAVGLADQHGRVAVLTAPSGTGKTTIARTLAQHLGYVSDETVAVRPDGTIVPYPKPLSVIESAGTPKRQVGPDAFGLCPVKGLDLHAQVLIVLDRSGVAGQPPRLEPMPTTAAVFELIPQISYLVDAPNRLQGLLTLISRCRGVYRLIYSEADEVLKVVEEALAHPPHREVTWAPASLSEAAIPTDPSENSSDTKADNQAQLRLNPDIHDAVWVEDTLIVLTQHQVLQLDGLGPMIWSILQAEGSVSFARLRDEIVGSIPPPAGICVDDVLRETLEDLQTRSVLL